MEVKKYRMARSWLTDPDSGNSAGQWKNFVQQRAQEWKARQGFKGAGLVEHGPRVGFTKAGVVKKGGNPYMEDKAFVKWAKKNYPDLFSTRTMKEGRIEIADVATAYERMIAKKDKR